MRWLYSFTFSLFILPLLLFRGDFLKWIISSKTKNGQFSLLKKITVENPSEDYNLSI